jgi:hypothetical protein
MSATLLFMTSSFRSQYDHNATEGMRKRSTPISLVELGSEALDADAFETGKSGTPLSSGSCT